jgi:hypothetical protein
MSKTAGEDWSIEEMTLPFWDEHRGLGALPAKHELLCFARSTLPEFV